MLLFSGNVFSADCIPEKQFGLAGFIINKNESTLSKKLARAKRVENLTGEDDGGGYKYKRYTYPHYKVEIVRRVVDRIYTDSPKINTTNGLRVGLSIDKALKILGVKSLKWSTNKKEFYMSMCEKPYADIFVVVKVGDNKKISFIEFVKNRP